MNTKTLTRKVIASLCISGVIAITNLPLVQACEVKLMNVTANIVDDSVSISPSKDKFCNDGSLKVEVKSALTTAEIYYTTDGTDPVCGKNGTKYSAPFALTSSKTVKAVACHDAYQSLMMYKSYTVSSEFCERSCDNSIKINKVYYNADSAHMAGTCPLENEWVELYNPTNDSINIKNWKICDGKGCDTLTTGNLSVPGKGYLVVTDKSSTWKFWNVPSDVTKINLGSEIGGNGLDNAGDTLQIKDGGSKVIDEVTWGTAANTVALAAAGSIMGRISNGYDHDKWTDWTIYSLPKVHVAYPNGDEKWTVGKTYNILWNASDNKSSLSVDLYYSKDSGKTWGVIAKGVSNNGSYSWRVPLKIASADNGSDYLTASSKARVKVVATDYSKNFMLSNWDISDKDFCPPIDLSLLTPEEIAYLKTIDTTGLEIIDSATDDSNGAAAMLGNTAAGSTTQGETAPAKTSEIKNETGEDYILSDSTTADSNADKDKKDVTDVEAVANTVAMTAAAATDTVSGSDVSTSKPIDKIEETAPKTEASEENDGSTITPDTDASIAFNLNA